MQQGNAFFQKIISMKPKHKIIVHSMILENSELLNICVLYKILSDNILNKSKIFKHYRLALKQNVKSTFLFEKSSTSCLPRKAVIFRLCPLQEG